MREEHENTYSNQIISNQSKAGEVAIYYIYEFANPIYNVERERERVDFLCMVPIPSLVLN